jgi:pSer/pThr/pTyr-binding forkhead associated (FHA) protein
MKFAVRYPGGAVHEIGTPGNVAVIGRDPACDIVLNDPKASRRHAVVESGPDGLVVRDTGSANGLAVNGLKTERSPLKDGDVIRIGDVELTVLGEREAGTLAMDEAFLEPVGGGPPPNTATLPPMDSFPPPPGAKAPTAARAETAGRAVTMSSSAPWALVSRPLTITVLAVLWVLSIPFHILTGFALAQARPGSGGMVLAVLLVLLAVVAVLMAWGMWTARGWARPAQITLAALGILNCPFAPASIAVLVYMLRAPARRYFAHAGGDTTADESEAIFAAAVVAAVVLGGLITAGLTVVARTARTGLP